MAEEQKFNLGKTCDIGNREEGNDSMTATPESYVYQVFGKKESTQKEPTVSQERLNNIKESISKFLGPKK